MPEIVTTVSSWIGLLAVGYAVWRLALALSDHLTHQRYVRSVMTGETPSPWEAPLPVRRGIYDFDSERYV